MGSAFSAGFQTGGRRFLTVLASVLVVGVLTAGCVPEPVGPAPPPPVNPARTVRDPENGWRPTNKPKWPFGLRGVYGGGNGTTTTTTTAPPSDGMAYWDDETLTGSYTVGADGTIYKVESWYAFDWNFW